TLDAMRFFAGQYLQDVSHAPDPRASPMRAADLKGLPAAVITTAEFDPLRDEGEAYAKRLEQAGVPVAYFREAGMIHGYFGMGAASPAADLARRRATAEFKRVLLARAGGAGRSGGRPGSLPTAPSLPPGGAQSCDRALPAVARRTRGGSWQACYPRQGSTCASSALWPSAAAAATRCSSLSLKQRVVTVRTAARRQITPLRPLPTTPHGERRAQPFCHT